MLGNHRIRTSNGTDNEHQGKIIYNLEIAKKTIQIRSSCSLPQRITLFYLTILVSVALPSSNLCPGIADGFFYEYLKIWEK